MAAGTAGIDRNEEITSLSTYALSDRSDYPEAETGLGWLLHSLSGCPVLRRHPRRHVGSLPDVRFDKSCRDAIK